MNTFGDRRGMTLVELIMVAVLGTVVLASLFQVLISNQRSYAAQNAMVQDQQSLRAGIDVLSGELREISPADGDLVEMQDHWLRVRSARSLGLVCSVLSGGSNPTVRAKVIGRYLRGDSARVFYENDPALVGDDDWRTARVEVEDSTGLLTCPDGEPAQSVQLNGITYGSLAAGDSITPGALVRNFRHFRYELGSYEGEPFLVRVDSADEVAPLVGPLRAGDGVEFRYLDGSGATAVTATDVRQIEVTLRTEAEFVNADGTLLSDSLKIRIHTRNTT